MDLWFPSYSAGRTTGQKCTGTADAAPSRHLAGVRLLLGQFSLSEFTHTKNLAQELKWVNTSQYLTRQGPRLPYFLHVKKFSSVDQAFETPMDSLLYKLVRGPLTELLGGNIYSTRTATPCGYTVGKHEESHQGLHTFVLVVSPPRFSLFSFHTPSLQMFLSLFFRRRNMFGWRRARSASVPLGTHSQKARCTRHRQTTWKIDQWITKLKLCPLFHHVLVQNGLVSGWSEQILQQHVSPAGEGSH